MMDGIEAGETDQNEVDRDDVVQEPRNDEDQDSSNQSGERCDVRGRQVHGKSPSADEFGAVCTTAFGNEGPEMKTILATGQFLPAMSWMVMTLAWT
jgi:hypothetical protein